MLIECFESLFFFQDIRYWFICKRYVIDQIDIIVIWQELSIIIEWTTASHHLSGVIKFCGAVKKLDMGFPHEIFKFLDFFLKTLLHRLFPEALCHFELLLKGCSVMKLSFFSRYNTLLKPWLFRWIKSRSFWPISLLYLHRAHRSIELQISDFLWFSQIIMVVSRYMEVLLLKLVV